MFTCAIAGEFPPTYSPVTPMSVSILIPKIFRSALVPGS
jgi:hypothetical protein